MAYPGVVAMTEAMIVVLAVGMFLGFGIGRWWAEYQRARVDMRRVWNSRRSYRDG
jgi:hypothetical protein